jgi:nicotinate-nucleotide adenylyltransferase
VGLLGGSFNPAHDGHRHIAEIARRRLGLDQVWLMVSPGNPLKPRDGMAPMAARLGSARRIADGRRIVATAIEARLGTRYTADTLRALRTRFPCAHFVWLMGADNLVQLPRWRRWDAIVTATPFAVLPRPTYTRAALAGAAAHRLAHARRTSSRAAALAAAVPPAWTFLPVAQRAVSASALRAVMGGKAIDTPIETGASAETPSSPRRPAVRKKSAVAAGPRRSPARAAKPFASAADTASLDRMIAVIVTSLEDDKAEAVVTLDVAGRAAFADRMVIASGLADRQIAAMASHLEEKLREAGLGRVRIEGARGSDWVLIDAGDVVVHLFKPEARALYALERMWGADLDEQAEGVGAG